MANKKRQRSEPFEAPTKKEIQELLTTDPDELLNVPALEVPSDEEVTELLNTGEVIQDKTKE